MKAFSRWLLLALIGSAAFAGACHVWLTQNPRKVVVIVDASFPMREVWARVPQALARIEGGRYRRYALETEKAVVHDYAGKLSPGRITVYAPRDFSRLVARAPALAEADAVYLVTNADQQALEGLPRWQVVRP